MSCRTADDLLSAKEVSSHFGVDLLELDLTEEYLAQVFNPFLVSCRNGKISNPDIDCNAQIKFGLLFRFLNQYFPNFIYLATGHYAEISKKDNVFLLKKGIDKSKDQSYFLSTIDPKYLKNLLFPLGGTLKSEVKKEVSR